MDHLSGKAEKGCWRHKYTQRPDCDPSSEEVRPPPPSSWHSQHSSCKCFMTGAPHALTFQADCWHHRHIWYYFPTLQHSAPSSLSPQKPPSRHFPPYHRGRVAALVEEEEEMPERVGERMEAEAEEEGRRD